MHGPAGLILMLTNATCGSYSDFSGSLRAAYKMKPALTNPVTPPNTLTTTFAIDRADLASPAEALREQSPLQ